MVTLIQKEDIMKFNEETFKNLVSITLDFDELYKDTTQYGGEGKPPFRASFGGSQNIEVAIPKDINKANYTKYLDFKCVYHSISLVRNENIRSDSTLVGYRMFANSERDKNKLITIVERIYYPFRPEEIDDLYYKILTVRPKTLERFDVSYRLTGERKQIIDFTDSLRTVNYKIGHLVQLINDCK